MTKKLLARLKAECRSMEHELTRVLPEEIRKAVAMGDLSENAEYESALHRQRMVQTQIRTIKRRISEISVIDLDRLPKDRVGYGSIVVLLDLDDDSEITYQLVVPEDADVQKNRISLSSPIGKALTGQNQGDEVRVQVPSGVKNFEILELTVYGDTDQDL
jgi:transcription elongation factor GreA